MKTYLYTTLVLTCLPLIIYSQFSPAIFIDDQQEDFTSHIKVADFNNDGKNDMLTAGDKWPLDMLKLYLSEGNNSFITVPLAELDHILSIDAADINDDSRIDFAVISGVGTTNDLSWYENDGDGFTHHSIADIDQGMNQVILKDFNNDGLIDMLTLEHAEVVLRRSVSPGVFAEREAIAGVSEYYAIDANDYNGDQFLDVAVATATGFFILINNEGNSFSFTSSAGDSICFGLQSGDVDADGDNDIVAYDTLRGLRLYKNQGTGSFQFHSTLVNSTDNFRIFGLTDLNCDGTLDLQTVMSQQGEVIWLSNDGAGIFSQPLVVHDFGGVIYASAYGDLNNDDKPELIFGRDDLAIAVNECQSMGLPEQENSQIIIYPNPAEDFLYIQNLPENVGIQIFDISKRLVKTGLTADKINVSNLPKGVYYLTIKGSNHSQTLQFIKK